MQKKTYLDELVVYTISFEIVLLFCIFALVPILCLTNQSSKGRHYMKHGHMNIKTIHHTLIDIQCAGTISPSY